MSISHYHTIIAGAGPGGCAAAIRLRQHGLSVALVDDVNDDQRKVGESLPGASWRLLKGLGIDGLDDLLPRFAYENCMANRSAWGTEKWTYNDALRNPEGGGWHVLRHRFDAALRQKTKDLGVDFYKAKVGAIQAGEQYQIGFKTNKSGLPERLSCDWLIDATGRARAVVRQLGVKRLSYEKQMAAACWLRSNGDDQDKTTTIKSVSNGWWYTAKLPDGTRVLSFHGLPDAISKFVKSPTLFLAAANKTSCISYQLTDENILENIVARDASVSKINQTVANNWIAVGDAALSFDPLSSQGMFFALYSGLKSAEAILKTKGGDVSALISYEQQVARVFEANQRSRAYFYQVEQRFSTNAYWTQYRKTTKRNRLETA